MNQVPSPETHWVPPLDLYQPISSRMFSSPPITHRTWVLEMAIMLFPESWLFPHPNGTELFSEYSLFPLSNETGKGCLLPSTFQNLAEMRIVEDISGGLVSRWWNPSLSSLSLALMDTNGCRLHWSRRVPS
ncbi:hypothetical protein TorRG33x02_069720 [Trema orientale]|uniref:Uncharacterized protein n=1 Tax=Trema orientale TaxID=63057 RepID=A0A2P5FHG5_TREOI|nr:hypothetical protein TorRG33x02_069720 [Trema orientale]